jgi:hypothetical protein
MKLSKALSPFLGLWLAVTIAFWPTLKEVLRNPILLLRPAQLSQLYMSKLWLVFGDGIDGNTKPLKNAHITPNAYGVVLDIGAGGFLSW